MDKRIITEHVSVAGLYEGLAEEASELAAVASKTARILRDENPTPITYHESVRNLLGELSDLQNYLDLLYLKPQPDLQKEKMDRFINRVATRYLIFDSQKEDSNNDSGNQ